MPDGEFNDDPAALIEHVTSACMSVLMMTVHDHVPAEHRAAVLRHLAQRINMELKVRALIASGTLLPPFSKDDDP